MQRKSLVFNNTINEASSRRQESLVQAIRKERTDHPNQRLIVLAGSDHFLDRRSMQIEPILNSYLQESQEKHLIICPSKPPRELPKKENDFFDQSLPIDYPDLWFAIRSKRDEAAQVVQSFTPQP